MALLGRKPISWHFHGLVKTMKALSIDQMVGLEVIFIE